MTRTIVLQAIYLSLLLSPEKPTQIFKFTSNLPSPYLLALVHNSKLGLKIQTTFGQHCQIQILQKHQGNLVAVVGNLTSVFLYYLIWQLLTKRLFEFQSSEFNSKILNCKVEYTNAAIHNRICMFYQSWKRSLTVSCYHAGNLSYNHINNKIIETQVAYSINAKFSFLICQKNLKDWTLWFCVPFFKWCNRIKTELCFETFLTNYI